MGEDDGFAARVGTHLRRRWRLTRLIGVGGLAGVYEAEHTVGRRAAIKLLRPEVAAEPDIRARLEREARTSNAVGHSGLVEVLDVDETDDGTPFLVMELLQGQTLAEVGARDPLPVDRLLTYVDETLDVLVACHDQGVVHRDIKPGNLFVTTEGHIKVLDLGGARVREGMTTLTEGHLATVAFMAPEQAAGGDVDARADLFGLGATMFKLLAGRHVHLAPDEATLATMVLTRPAPPFTSVAPAPHDDPPLGWVVDRALAFLAAHRYPDARTMRGDVWALQRKRRPPYAFACHESGPSPHATSPDQPHPPSTAAAGELPATDPQLPVFPDSTPGEEATPNEATPDEAAP
ncbi:MAG: protein kinase [Myxococcota bacterium]